MFRFLSALCCLLFTIALWGQSVTTTQTPLSVRETRAVFIGKTKAVRDLTPKPATSPARKARIKRQRPPRNFVGRGMDYDVNPNALPKGEDPLRQQLDLTKSINNIPLLVNQEGISANFAPHDPSGDVGKEYYLQIVNITNFQVLNKDGSPASGIIAANTLWNSIGFSSAGDPIVMYDQEAQRWIITEFPNGNQLLFAISATSDPLGEYMAYNFATPIFPDYPKYSIWNDEYVVTTNETGIANQTSYFIDRSEMLAGAATVPIQRIEIPGFNNGPGFFVGTPVDWTGNTPPPADRLPMIVRQNDDEWGNTGEDAIDIISINVDFDNPANTALNTISVAVSPYDGNPCSAAGAGFACVPQLGGNGIDAVPDVIMNQVHYLNFGTHESMVMSFITDVTGGDNLSGIRWIEMRRDVDNDWSLYQEGTWSPDGLDRYMPSIAMDLNGNISLAYSASSEEAYVSLRLTGRRASDPLGEMTLGETMIVDGQSAINSGGRYCDYAHMALDPIDGRTFWFTSEYPESNRVTTRVASWSLQRDTLDIAANTLLTPQTGTELTDTETVTFLVKNEGLDTVNSFNVGYIFEGGSPVVEAVDFQLLPDSTYLHTFGPTVDMAALGTYEFKLFTDFALDEADFNDTLQTTRTQLPRNDAGVTNVGDFEPIVCGTENTILVTFQNFSGLPLTSANINVEINGGTPIVTEWTGTLATNESTSIDILLTELPDGPIELNVYTSLPNGMVDEVEANDGRTVSFTVDQEGLTYELNINFDFYPEDISWELVDEEDEVLFSGGNYGADFEFGTFTQVFCLSADACYTFTIFDSFGDGFEVGGYSIEDENGDLVVESSGNFTTIETNEFCDQPACNLTVEVDVAPASAFGVADGMIMLTLSNTGMDIFQVSIDGGLTFSDSISFDSLASGTYDIVVSNGQGCEYTETVVIEQPSSIVTTRSGQRLVVFPNPTNGVFRVELTGLNNQGTFLPVEIFDAAGRRVQAGQLVRYDLEYTGQFSLTYEPNGTYFMRVISDQTDQLLRIVKR